MNIFLLFLAAIGSIYALWIFYLAVMSLKRARDAGEMSITAYRLGLPVLYLGLLIDFLVNVIILSIIMLELPKEWLVTSRLSRHLSAGTGWRAHVAAWFCTNLLDTFDPSGCHCKKVP
jgi:hypothetical protein